MRQAILDAVQNFSWITYVLVFFGASVLSMGSCTLARIPVVVGYVGGTATSRKRAFYITLSFVAGLVLTYTCIGVLLGTVAAMTQHLVRWSTLLYYLIGAVAIFIGLYLLGFLRFRFQGKVKKWTLRISRR